jgi:hypothetical protein
MSTSPASALSRLLPEDLLRVMQLREVSDAALLGSDKVKDAMLHSGDKVALAMAQSADTMAISFGTSMEKAGKWVFLGCLCMSAAYVFGSYLDYQTKMKPRPRRGSIGDADC